MITLHYRANIFYVVWLQSLGFSVTLHDGFMPDYYQGVFCDNSDEGYIAREELNSLRQVWVGVMRKKGKYYENIHY